MIEGALFHYPANRVIEKKQGLLAQELRPLPMDLSRANNLSGGSLRTSTEIGRTLMIHLECRCSCRHAVDEKEIQRRSLVPGQDGH